MHKNRNYIKVIDFLIERTEKLSKKIDTVGSLTLKRKAFLRMEIEAIIRALNFAKNLIEKDQIDSIFLILVSTISVKFGEAFNEIYQGKSYSNRMSFYAGLRKANDPKQIDKEFVYECWQDWQKKPNSYASKAAFSRDMLEKCEHLISQKKIEDWCRKWEKANPAG